MMWDTFDVICLLTLSTLTQTSSDAHLHTKTAVVASVPHITSIYPPRPQQTNSVENVYLYVPAALALSMIMPVKNR